ncbi:unnamed protein product [Gemmata massiliana]|uniref:DUF4440 domain-containing protein n=1 Tax=Gemmata massiliana TaxID=1210884 RepID=A0A6P2DI76_9BACT|nr:hypothetical protein [Gemmata massiliana]VTS01044.1 unnamed protein product [Gemmata massiliana]
MRLFALLAASSFAALVAPASGFGDEKDDKKKAEVEWAKEVAVDFIKAIQTQEYIQARRLLTPELAKEFEKRVPDAPAPLDVGRFTSWEFDADKVSPDKDEVAVRGRLRGKDGLIEHTSAFSIRLVKAKEPGRWRIDFFLFERCQEVPAKK